MTIKWASDIVFSMRKSIILLILLLFSFDVYPFWIWSPKTQEWKNPKYAALATPYLQYKQALKSFEEERFKDAYREFKKLLIHYPDAREAAQAQYYLGRCLVKLDKHYEAFKEYQKLIDSYPNSQRINEVVEREYNIGEYFLNREHKKWLGLSLYDFVEHPSIEIFRSIVSKIPYSEYAPRAQYKVGTILVQLSRYEEAREAFQKVIDNYSDSEWAAPAKYQLALATSKASPGADYDSTYLKEAASRLDEFIKSHPEAKISRQAEDQLKMLRNKEAKKAFDTGQFYENQEKYESGIIYYKKVVNNHPDSDYYNLAVEEIEELKELIKGNITKSGLKKREKKEEAEFKRMEKVRLKDEKIREKEKGREEKISKKQERIRKLKERKIQRQQAKLERKEEIKAKKQALREEKIQKKKEIRACKARKKEEKINVKQKRIREKREFKEQKRQDKFKKEQRAKAAKKALKEEKISKKQERIQKKKELKEQKRQEKLKRKQEAIAEKQALKEQKLRKKRELKKRKTKKFWFW